VFDYDPKPTSEFRSAERGRQNSYSRGYVASPRGYPKVASPRETVNTRQGAKKLDEFEV
jgi:hypothetical protein